MIYLDSAATTSVAPEVVEAMMPYLTEYYGNPSSMHDVGYKAKQAVEDSRDKIAEFLNCDRDEIFFTSGGSESNNMVINRLNLKKKDTLITSPIEHHSVLNAAKSLKSDVYYVPVDKYGVVNKRAIESAYETHKKGLISIMLVNNELGTCQPIDKTLIDNAHSNGFLFHSDATQAFGKMPINIKHLRLDFMSASAHKIHGPKGVGLLVARKWRQDFLNPIIAGGQQERNHRAGTENVAGIVGFAKAVELCAERMEEERNNVKLLSKYLIENLIEEVDCTVNGLFYSNVGGIVNMKFNGIRGEQLVEYLNEHNICCSSGSACDSKSKQPSHVLKAIGLTDVEANSSVRFSLDGSITVDDIDYVIKAIKGVMPLLKGE